MSAKERNNLEIVKYLISGVIMVAVSALVVLALNLSITYNESYEKAMNSIPGYYDNLLEAEKRNIDEEFKKLAQGKEEELLGGGSKNDGNVVDATTAELLIKKGKAEINKKYSELETKLKKQNNYYEYYTKNNHENTKEQRDYHYYGQFYEMFVNDYDANVIFIGSSRSVYGINPKKLEENDALDEYSFYNFSLNAAGPSYYLEWYDVFKNEAEYPTPDTVIYCVDWFMFDSGNWMWREMNYDTRKGGALYEIRKHVNSSAYSMSNETTVTEEDITTEAPNENLPIQDGQVGTAAASNFEEFIEQYFKKMSKKDPVQLFVDWWNGKEHFNLSFVSEGINTFVSPFADQKDLFSSLGEIVTNVCSGEWFFNTRFNEEKARHQVLFDEGIEAYREQKQAEFDEIWGEIPDGGNNNGNDSNTDTEVIDVEAELAKYEAQKVTDIKRKYYSKSFRKDKDGNISSKFYKGFIPWEYEHHHEGTGAQFHDIKKSEVPRVKGTSQDQIKAFKQLIRQMQADGIKVILVQIPDYAKLRPDDQIAEYTALIDDIANELGVEFYDYNNTSSKVGNTVANYKANFSNWNHMNETGANKFSAAFAKELVDILK